MTDKREGEDASRQSRQLSLSANGFTGAIDLTDIQPHKSKRKALSKRTRFDVFKRDGFVCQYCGSHPPAAVLHCDHVIPIADGGDNDPDNLVTSCSDCNFGKAANPLSVVPQSLADKAARVSEAEQQVRGYSAIIQARKDRLEEDAWGVVFELFAADNIRKDWFTSVKKFVDLIGVQSCKDAAEIAVARGLRSESDVFRYFCGICWKVARPEQ